MTANELNTKIELYKNTGDTNNPELVFYKKIWAGAKFKSGALIIQSYQIFNSKTQTLKIRKRDDINDLMYIKFKNEYYQIMNIQESNNMMLIDIVLSNYRENNIK